MTMNAHGPHLKRPYPLWMKIQIPYAPLGGNIGEVGAASERDRPRSFPRSRCGD